MKKSLVLAMAMALGVTASAYAANPFSDVPAGHWAYDSVSKLAAAGVIEGYGDTTFGGDKLMTRYEMAQIVAKAMAKGGNVDKLAAEFADELESLGVRVSKLEKKADNVKITGKLRMQNKAYHGTLPGTNSWSRMRSDIGLKGDINEDWSYTGLIRNEQRFDKGQKNVGEEKLLLKEAYVSGKLGGLKVMGGHYFEYLADGFIYDWNADGIVASYGGKKLNLTAGYAQLDTETDENIIYYVANAALGKAATATVGYYDLRSNNSDFDGRDLISAKLGLNLGKNANIAYTYIHSNERDEAGGKHAHNIALNYKGAQAAKPGSFGLEAIRYNQDEASYLSGWHTADAVIPNDAGFTGWKVGGGYTVAKNIVANVAWYDLEAKGRGGHTGTLFTDVHFIF